MRLELGARARCSDGAERKLVDVVIDADSHRVTHLVVQPGDDSDGSRLVPIELAAGGDDDGEISLRCTAATLDELAKVREHAFLGAGEQAAEEESGWEVGVRDVQPMPRYGPGAFGEFGGELSPEVIVAYDRVPKGEIELRHASAIYSADRHHLGSVDGVVVDADTRISHLLLGRGHLWWSREISIPEEAIAKFATDMVTLGATKDEVGGFPSERR
jgi:sporulation protein YlmC with PRC-barrel domain